MDIVRTTCSLCEACCGAIMEVRDNKITKVMPDRDDPLSGGFICAKGAAIPELESDPDRLRSPLIKRDGKFSEVSWDEAFAFIDTQLNEIIARSGRNSVGVYLGNAMAHNLSLLTYFPILAQALGSTNLYSAGSLDQIPRQAVSAMLYGDEYSVTVPDIDRSQLLWIIGANPAESNGSLMVAPGFLGRMQELQRRGGRVVVIDPRRTMTAKRASEHVAIRPSGDAAFLAAVAHVILAEGPIQSTALDLCRDLTELKKILLPFTPERVAAASNVDAATIRRLALELRDTPASALYGRMGTTTQVFSSLVSWLIDVVNILAGNLDVPGGAMFPKPLLAQGNSVGSPGIGEGFSLGRWKTRVRGAPEVLGQFPMACFAEEMETPGPGQIRALITVAGNPVISSPESARLQKLLDGLEFIVSQDIYLNEMTSKATVILPSPPRLTKTNYDSFLYRFAVRSYGRYTAAFRSTTPDERSDREILLRLTAILKAIGWDADIDALDESNLLSEIILHTKLSGSIIEGRNPHQIMESIRPLSPLDRRMDFGLRVGPFGDGFGSRQGISFETLRESPQGLDCGPLAPRLPEILRTRSGTIELMHSIFESELIRLNDWLDVPRASHVLIGRRQLRSNNSWMHNLSGLRHRTHRCTAQINDVDAENLGLCEGDSIAIATAKGSIEVPVEITPDIVSGVVSVPHGWGHASMSDMLRVASAYPGVNVNDVIDYEEVDPLTWTARVNGVEVSVTKVQPKN